LSSSGPIFHRGIRSGLDGKPFRIFKFRSMVKNAEKIGGQSTGKDDSRITSLGRWLRAYKIDELPQLFNILKGEMSFVGPRPEFPEHTQHYKGDEKYILSVLPGITDHASVQYINLGDDLGKGEFSEIDRNYVENIRPEKTRLRLYYVLNRSFLGDIRLIFLTLTFLFVKKKRICKVTTD